MQKANYFKYIVAVLAAAVFISIFFTGGGISAYAAVSESSVVSAFENRNVLDDLEGSTIDGKLFDFSDWGFNERKDTQLLAFVEFGYSYKSDNLQDFGLYIYVYNPKGLDYVTDSTLNKISLRYADINTSNYYKYNLQFLNQSMRGGFEGLFYKYKVVLTESQSDDILNTVNSSARVYEVADFELLINGESNATSYKVSKKYIYTGYAEGYGSAVAAGDSLNCTNEGTTALQLKVCQTTYRPEGTNGKNNYTQDSLDSVYFSIPNEIVSEYGGLSAVHATWLNAKTNPIFVTGNETIYNALLRLVEECYGEPINLDYCWAANAVQGIEPGEWYADLYYGDTPKIWNNGVGDPDSNKYLKNLYYLFYAENRNADDYVLSGKQLLDYIKNYSLEFCFNDCEVAGKYSSKLFEVWDNEYTDIEIFAGDKYSLTNEKLTQNFWDKMFNKWHVESSETFENINAIHKVSETDFKDSVAETCRALYISERDYNAFKSFYDSSIKKNETVYLFRYFQGEYESRECTEFAYKSAWGVSKADLNKIDTNAYLSQEWIHLDFDVIDVTCTKGNVKTVIGIVSSPQDIVPDVTPPVITTESGGSCAGGSCAGGSCAGLGSWLPLIIAAVVVILLIILFPSLLTLLGYIVKAVIWLVTLPFKAIEALIKKVKESRAERQAAKAEAAAAERKETPQAKSGKKKQPKTQKRNKK